MIKVGSRSVTKRFLYTMMNQANVTHDAWVLGTVMDECTTYCFVWSLSKIVFEKVKRIF